MFDHPATRSPVFPMVDHPQIFQPATLASHESTARRSRRKRAGSTSRPTLTSARYYWYIAGMPRSAFDSSTWWDFTAFQRRSGLLRNVNRALQPRPRRTATGTPGRKRRRTQPGGGCPRSRRKPARTLHIGDHPAPPGGKDLSNRGLTDRGSAGDVRDRWRRRYYATSTPPAAPPQHCHSGPRGLTPGALITHGIAARPGSNSGTVLVGNKPRSAKASNMAAGFRGGSTGDQALDLHPTPPPSGTSGVLRGRPRSRQARTPSRD